MGASDGRRYLNPLKTFKGYNYQFLSGIDAKLCLSHVYDARIRRRWTPMMVNNSIIVLGTVQERISV